MLLKLSKKDLQDIERLTNKLHHKIQELKQNTQKIFQKYEKHNVLILTSDVLQKFPELDKDTDTLIINNKINNTKIWQNIDREEEDIIIKEQFFIGSDFSHKEKLLEELIPVYEDIVRLSNSYNRMNSNRKVTEFNIDVDENRTMLYIVELNEVNEVSFG